jgi:hypothetical protein
MHRVVTGIDVEDDLRWCGAARADEQLGQVVVEELDAAGLGGADFQQHRTFLPGQFGLAAGVGVLEAGQGGRAGQGVVGVGGDVGQDLEERVVAQVLGVVAVGVTGQDLVDGLGEEGLGGVRDVPGGAGVRQAPGQLRDDAQGLLQRPHGEQAGIADEATASKADVQLLRAHLAQGKVRFLSADHELEPPHGSKLLGKYSLDSARGSPFNDSVRDPG